MENWDNKLSRKYFTTIRVPNNYYKVGEVYDIVLKKQPQFKAKILEIKSFNIEKLNNFVSYLDAGLSVEAMTKLFNTMYKGQKEFVIILLEKQ